MLYVLGQRSAAKTDREPREWSDRSGWWLATWNEEMPGNTTAGQELGTPLMELLDAVFGLSAQGIISRQVSGACQSLSLLNILSIWPDQCQSPFLCPMTGSNRHPANRASERLNPCLCAKKSLSSAQQGHDAATK